MTNPPSRPSRPAEHVGDGVEEIDLSPEEEAALDASWDHLARKWAAEVAAGLRNPDLTLTPKGERYFSRAQRRKERRTPRESLRRHPNN